MLAMNCLLLFISILFALLAKEEVHATLGRCSIFTKKNEVKDITAHHRNKNFRTLNIQWITNCVAICDADADAYSIWCDMRVYKWQWMISGMCLCQAKLCGLDCEYELTIWCDLWFILYDFLFWASLFQAFTINGDGEETKYTHKKSTKTKDTHW